MWSYIGWSAWMSFLLIMAVFFISSDDTVLRLLGGLAAGIFCARIVRQWWA